MKNDPKRATGKTTGLILQSLGKAIENPGTKVEFIDHHNSRSYAHLKMCERVCETLAEKLGLDVTVSIEMIYRNGMDKCDGWKLFVKSNWVSPYSQRALVEEAFKENYGVYPHELATTADFECWKFFKRGFEAA